MTLPANALQAAIYQRLKATAGVPVFDHVPQNAAFPYVVIGADTTAPWETKDRDGQEFTITVHCWTAPAAGRKGVKSLTEAVYSALHRQEPSLAVPGHAVVLLRCEFAETIQEPAEGDSDHYYHAALRFRALVRTV